MRTFFGYKRSAREAEEKENQAIAKGETLPEEKRFDSNCITPGTRNSVVIITALVLIQ